MIDETIIRDLLTTSRDELPSANALAGWTVEVGQDWIGNDAVWIWLVFRDHLLDEVWEHRDALRDRVRELVEAASDNVEVFIRFRSESEHRGIVGEDWAG